MPSTDENLPGAHFWHCEDDDMVENEPRLQGAHADVVTAVENVPGKHKLHVNVVVAATVVEYWPTPHATQELTRSAPSFGEELPKGQGWQFVELTRPGSPP